jgi:simple sugar transport system ATP-binding protein
MRGVVKRYGTVIANDGIDLELGAGRILGLLGENGSGKTTLMRVLFGMILPDAGTIEINGAPLKRHSPAQAIEAGVAMIHQHLMLIEAATVLDNVMLGWHEAGGILRRRAIAARIRQTSAELALDLHPDARVSDLSLGGRQRVEILKAVLRGADLLILDEPTSNLAPLEIDGLLAVLRRLRARGAGIVFISHKLGEVLAVCDEIVVLRAGRVASRASAAGASREALAAAMIGADRPMPRAGTRDRRRSDIVRLRATNLAGPGLPAIDLQLAAGSVLGIAGVDGNGQIELVELLSGMRRPASGTLSLDGADITRASVAARARAGLAYMPADRSRTSLSRTMSITENLRLRRRSGRPADPRALMRAFDIRSSNPRAAVATLSGGNQQKIVVAREIGSEPAVLLAHQPTSGLDPGATAFVLERIAALRDSGAAILYVSSELDEILAIADRVAVLFNFRLAGPVEREAADASRLGLWMSGGDPA